MTTKKPPGEKMKAGRPTLYRAEYPEQARKYCLLGADNQKLARLFEVADTTIDKWIADIPEFSGAVKAGRDEADATVAKSLYHRAIGYEHPAVKIFMPAGSDAPVYADYMERYPPDTGAAMAWLKNRQPHAWRDKTDINLSGSIALENMTDEQIELRLVELTRKKGTRGAAGGEGDQG